MSFNRREDEGAAEIAVSEGANGVPALVTVAGDLVLNDAVEFRNKTATLTKAVVAFQSPGGNLVAGIEIGETIRLKNFLTFVPSDMFCTSACAYAWLGGTKRYMGRSARVGFHVAFIEKDGQLIESGQGNAVLGAYLTRIWLPLSAVVYVTEASPTSITWPTPENASLHGIEVGPAEAMPSINNMKVEPVPLAPNGDHRSFWNHNGSVVYLESADSERRFYYHQPRDGMLAAGARQEPYSSRARGLAKSISAARTFLPDAAGDFLMT